VTSPGFCSQYCGYHDNNGNFKYAFIGVPPASCRGCYRQSTSPNGNPLVEGAVDTIAHELEETATDPFGNAWFNSVGDENGDACDTTYPNQLTGKGFKYNIVVGGLKYLIQSNYNLRTKTCTMS